MTSGFAERSRGEWVLTADRTKLSVATIYDWLSTQAYWATGRSRDMVETSIANSHLYGVITPAGDTVACARMITDQVTFGWVGDVFVDAAYRGRGLGTWMVGEIVQYWTEVGVLRILLATRDAHGVYEKIGFAPLAHPERMMQIDRRPTF